MFRLSDLTPPLALVCKTPTDPLASMQCQLLLGNVQGQQSHVYKSSISGVGDVLVKVLKPHLRPLKGYDDVVSMEVSLRQSGVPVAELLSYHEWVDFGVTKNAIIYRFYSGGDLFTQILRLHQSKSICAQRTEFIAYSMAKMLCTCLATCTRMAGFTPTLSQKISFYPTILNLIVVKHIWGTLATLSASGRRSALLQQAPLPTFPSRTSAILTDPLTQASICTLLESYCTYSTDTSTRCRRMQNLS